MSVISISYYARCPNTFGHPLYSLHPNSPPNKANNQFISPIKKNFTVHGDLCFGRFYTNISLKRRQTILVTWIIWRGGSVTIYQRTVYKVKKTKSPRKSLVKTIHEIWLTLAEILQWWIGWAKKKKRGPLVNYSLNYTILQSTTPNGQPPGPNLGKKKLKSHGNLLEPICFIKQISCIQYLALTFTFLSSKLFEIETSNKSHFLCSLTLSL